jgi:hypothetical protein
MRNTE